MLCCGQICSICNFLFRHFDFKCHTKSLRKLWDCKYFGSLFLQCCFDGKASLIKKCLVAWRILCCGILNNAFIEYVHVYICIHVVVVPHQLTCKGCTEFNCVCCTRLHGMKENTIEGCASINYFHCYAVDKFAAFAIICCWKVFFDKIRLTCLCEKMLAPHIRLSQFRK